MPYADKEKERAYQKEHYEKNKELYKQRAATSRPVLAEKGRKYVRAHLESHPCVDCGNSDVRVLQFDHREPGKKLSNVSGLFKSFGLLKREIEKCDVRCANCHMIRTASQFGWERPLIPIG